MHYVPPPQDVPDYPFPYQPCKVVVLGLTSDADLPSLYAYFANFGEVKSCVIKVRPNTQFAFVEFGSEAAVALTLAMAPHMIKHAQVCVCVKVRKCS